MPSIGGFAGSTGPSGTFDFGAENYFCNFCQSLVQAPKGSGGLERCPTRGCKRPVGFGSFAFRPAAPRIPERRPSR